MRFRSDKNAPRDIKAESATYVCEEVIAALKVRATRKVAREEWLVKPKTLQPDTALQLSLSSLAQRGSKHSVEVVKDGTVGIKKDVHILVTTPGDFPARAEVFLIKKEIAAEGGITSAAYALRRVIRAVQGVCGRLSTHGTDAKCQVKLLSECCAPAQQKHRKGRAQ